MDQYVALDVSLQKTAVCVLNVSGRVLIEADVPSEPAALIAFIQTHAPRAAGDLGCQLCIEDRPGLITAVCAATSWGGQQANLHGIDHPILKALHRSRGVHPDQKPTA